jgi:hypothetical protein
VNALRVLVAVAAFAFFIGLANAAAVTHDILATYTQKSVDKWGVPTLHSKIATSVAAANQAHADSGTGITLRILSFEPSLIQESGNFYTTHNNLRANVATKTRRDQIGADIVLMVTEDSGCGGAASLWWTWNPNLTMLDSFAVVTSNSLQATASSPCGAGDLTVAHEFGHGQGLLHDRESEPTEGLKAGYHFGYKVCVANGFRTVMSYKCPSINVPQLARFSDPTASYNGIPMGVAYEAAPYQAADAVRQLKKNAPIIANFRNAVVPMPPAPPTLTLKATPISVAAGGVSSLSWSSYAADQCTASGGWSGPRLTSGTESTGPLSASKTFTLSCTGPGGSVSRSATVSVSGAATTVPGTPQNLRVVANGPSVTLTWDPADTLAASFVVLRSKVSATGGQTYPQATGTTTLPTFTQTVAVGTWRYWVYARNSKGGSAHAGPVDVTVI